MDLIKQNTQTKIFKSILIIFLGSILLAISAKVKIPFYPVPMTMQTFVVLFFGFVFWFHADFWLVPQSIQKTSLEKYVWNVFGFILARRSKTHPRR